MPPLAEVLRGKMNVAAGRDISPVLAAPFGQQSGLDALAQVFDVMNYRTGIQVGVGDGASAEMLCKVIAKLKLTCVDPYVFTDGRTEKIQQQRLAEATRKSQECGFTLLQETSRDAFGKVAKQSVEFVHLNGDRDFNSCVMNIIAWSEKITPTGVIMVQGFCAGPMSGVVKAVEAYTHCHGINPWYVTNDKDPIAFWQNG